MRKENLAKIDVILSALLVVALGLIVFGYFQVKERDRNIASIQSDLEQTQNHLKGIIFTKDQELEAASNTIAALSEKLDLTEEELDDVERDYRKERNKNEDFEDQLEDLSGTLSDLDKLAKTDKELLQKYSKVSFLNEHYAPEKVKEIDDEWKYSEDKPNSLHSKVTPFFEDMMEEAKDDGIDLWVVSAYRSFDHQEALKGQYTVVYGEGANAFSADQGFSEHQLGTTIDLTTSGINGSLDGFQDTEAYEWMLDNAHKYGFVLSYPESNGYYIFEPWHWRFVGIDLAKDLHRDEAHFYDWDQRDIDAYLLHIFD